MKASSSPSPSPLAVAAAVLAVAACSGASATIESTCRQAAAGDPLVDVAYCTRQFTAYHGADEADAWGLAKAAALIGVNLADDAVYDIGNGKARAPRACAEAYDAVGGAFAEASDELGARRFAAARMQMARVGILVHRCDGGGRAPPELARYSAECRQMAVIGIAISRLLVK
ncbi:hypothetical protein ACP4OV_029190 [Aristida adscensionis]